MNLLNAIPYGKENARSRTEIVRLTGIKDREMRDRIKKLNEELVNHGECILSSSSVSGYWRTNNPSEIEAYVKEVKHRERELLHNAAPIIKLLYEMKSIKVVPVKAHFRRISPKTDDKQTRL